MTVVGLPAEFDALIAALRTASTAEARIAAVLAIHTALYGQPQWRAYAHSLLGCIVKGERERALQGLGGFLKLLIDNKKLSKRVALDALKACDSAFPQIQEKFKNAKEIPMEKNEKTTLDRAVDGLIQTNALLVQALMQQAVRPEPSNLADALVALFGNPDFGKAVGSRVDAVLPKKRTRARKTAKK